MSAATVKRQHAMPLRDAALAFGTAAARKQFEGRKGHGGNPDLAERHLKQPQLEALLAAAFEAGANLWNRRLVEALRESVCALKSKPTSALTLAEQTVLIADERLLRELGEAS